MNDSPSKVEADEEEAEPDRTGARAALGGSARPEPSYWAEPIGGTLIPLHPPSARMPPRPSRPRDAASLIIVRGRGAGASVLLGRREPRSRFMPSVYVFPGGRVDRRDASAPLASSLAPSVARKLRRQGDARRIRALGVAAVRETWEETGLRFGRMEAGRLRPALDGIDYVGRAITPSSSHIRYHARFFVVRSSSAAGTLAGNGELLDLRFVPIDEALGLPIIDVTQFMLQEVRARLVTGGASLTRSRRSNLFVHYRKEGLRLAHER